MDAAADTPADLERDSRTLAPRASEPIAAPHAGCDGASAGPLLFLSHAGADTEAARALKRRLEEAPAARERGLKVWFDKDDLRAGLSWQAQLEEAIEKRASAFAVYVGSKGVVNWVEAEVRLALSRAISGGGAGRFPFVPVIAKASVGSAALPGFARQFHAVRDVENKPEEFRKLLAAVLGTGGEAGALQAEEEPFFGLRAFDEERSHLFFGREPETGELVRRLWKQRLLAVVGDSGSGKSSLVRAGLVPRWRGGALAELEGRRADEEVWNVLEMRPGRDPRRALGEAVFDAAGALERTAEDRITYQRLAMDERDPALVRQGLRCGLPSGRTRTLVVVDQLEELVTLTPKEQRRPFVELLLELAEPDDEAFSVALTMRRDYYNLLSAAECRPLYERLEAQDRAALFLLGRMGDDGLRRIATEPLRLAGVGQGEREALAGAVLRDVGERPGDLALVQFALTRAWERRAEFGGDLLRAYIGVGRVDGALASEAKRAFEHVLGGEANEAEVAAALIRLARLEGTAGPTRRVARRREFPDGRWALLQTLADVKGNRLVLIGGRQPGSGADPGIGRETAEIAHEALLTRWDRLHAWLNEAPEDKRTLDRLADRAAEWADAATPEAKDRLLAKTDAEREAFAALAHARPFWLSAEERAFVEASVADYEAQLHRDKEARARERRLREEAEQAREREHKQRREAEEARRQALRQRRLALIGAVFATVLAVAASVASVAFYEARTNAKQQADLAEDQTREANRQREEAVKQRDRAFRAQVTTLAGAADREAAHGDAVTALLLALQPLVTAPKQAPRGVTAEAERAAYDALLHQHEVAVLRGHQGSVSSIAFAPDGRRLATGSPDGTARLWDAETGREVAVLRGHEGLVHSVALSPDGRRLATGSPDGTARLWDAGTGREVAVLRGHTGMILSVAFSPDGRRLVTSSLDNTARLWDAETGREVAVLRGHEGLEVLSIAFSPDGRRLATGSSDGTARLWDAETGREIAQLRGHRDVVLSVAFAPDGRRLATASSDRTARLWDAVAGREIAQLRGHGDAVLSVAFSLDGRRLATGSLDGTARLWDAFRSREELAAAATARLPRCLSPAQREAYGLAETAETAPRDQRQPAPPCWR